MLLQNVNVQCTTLLVTQSPAKNFNDKPV